MKTNKKEVVADINNKNSHLDLQLKETQILLTKAHTERDEAMKKHNDYIVENGKILQQKEAVIVDLENRLRALQAEMTIAENEKKRLELIIFFS